MAVPTGGAKLKGAGTSPKPGLFDDFSFDDLGLSGANVAAAGITAGISLWSSMRKIEAQAAEEAANIKAAEEAAQLQSNRNFQSFMLNTSRIQDQRALDSINVRMAANKAKDELALYQAGTNLSGSSINELDNEINRDAHRQKMQFEREARGKQTELRQQLDQGNENAVMQASQRRGSNFNRQKTSAFINAAAAGLSVA